MLNVDVVELGGQFVQQHSAPSVTFGSLCLTYRSTASCSNPAANRWWHKRRSVQHHEAKSSGAIARTLDESYKPGPPLSLECRASSTSRVWHRKPSGGRTFKCQTQQQPATWVGQPGQATRCRVPNKTETDLFGLRRSPFCQRRYV